MTAAPPSWPPPCHQPPPAQGGGTHPPLSSANSREAGFALAISLLVLLVVSLALTLISMSLILRMKAARQESQGVLLTALADAGLAEALSRLSLDASATGVAEHPFGSGTIASTITPVSSTQFTVVAQGRLGARTRRVQADVQRSPAAIQVSRWRVLAPSGGR